MKEHDKALGRRSRRLSSNSPASIRRLTLLAASVTFLAGPAAYAQDAYKAPPRATAVAPERRQNSELSDELAAIGGSRPSADAYIVDGIRPIEGSGIFTRRLVFKAGAKLVIVRGRSGGPVRIRADEVVIEGPGAGIFWSRPPAPSTTPSERGKAPSGTFGRAPGANGGNGLDGEPGNSGFAGSDAVDLVLAFREIAGSDLDVDLRGSDGGPGGRGQDGGDGGAGSQGGSATGSFFGCKSGPGRGGDGGAGGRAGAGGPGGPGGRGGTLIVMTPDIDGAGRIVHAYVGAGVNGPAGRPGLPGSGGEPGPEGPLAPPFCMSANRHGNRGSDGVGQASNIPPTAASTTGGFALVPFSPELSAQIFGPPQTP